MNNEIKCQPTRFLCKSIEDTKKTAEFFLTLARPGVCFALYGTLGTGKTTFSRFFIKTLIPDVAYVSSPTFTIVQTYEGVSKILKNSTLEIWHIDCYRLKNLEEFYEIGLEEVLENCITIVEWPEIIERLLPPKTIRLKFEMIDDVRTISLVSPHSIFQH